MPKIVSRIAALVLFGTSVLVAPASNAMVVNQMFEFGDSLSDSGTGNPPGIPYDYRFSNGPTTMEQLSVMLGVGPSLPAWPEIPGNSNTNFAVGGAMTGQGPVDPSLPGIAGAGLCCNYNWLVDSPSGVQSVSALQFTGLNNQIDLFKSRLGTSIPAFDPATTLFSVWGGPNDIFLALALAQGLPPDQQAAILQAYTINAAQNIGLDISNLAGLGGKNFLVPNMPNLGETPFGLGLDSAEQAAVTGISQLFNALLAGTLGQLEENLGLNIIEFDTYDALDALIQSGVFANTTQPCLDTTDASTVAATIPNVLGGCQGDLFFDSVHPTFATAEILAEEMRAAVPEPATFALLGLTLAAMGLRKHRSLSWQAGSRNS